MHVLDLENWNRIQDPDHLPADSQDLIPGLRKKMKGGQSLNQNHLLSPDLAQGLENRDRLPFLVIWSL